MTEEIKNSLEETVLKNQKPLYKRAKEILSYHLVDSTAVLAVCTPVFAALETTVMGLSNEVSINAKYLAAGLAYFGLGSLASRGRDSWRKFFEVNGKTNEKIQQFHDVAYYGSLNTVFSPIFYIISGVKNPKELVIGTALGVGFGLLSGGVIGYAIDCYRDLSGLKDSERIPKNVKKLSPKTKKSLVALITAASIGLTAGIYTLNSNKGPGQSAIKQTMNNSKE